MLSSQRGSDELFSTCVSNGPFIMSSSTSAGESARATLAFVSQGVP